MQASLIEEHTYGRRKDEQQVGNDGSGLTDQQYGASTKAVGQTPKPGHCQDLRNIVESNHESSLKWCGVELPQDKHWNDWNNGHRPRHICKHNQTQRQNAFRIHHRVLFLSWRVICMVVTRLKRVYSEVLSPLSWERIWTVRPRSRSA